MVTAASITHYSYFFEDVESSSERALLLDYDGTLAPFKAARRQSYPFAKVRETLDVITAECNTRVVVITGRAAHEVVPLLGLASQPEVWGSHGLERLFPDGTYIGPSVSDEAFEALSIAEESLHREGLGDRVEVKPGAVALHWRGLEAALESEVRAAGYRVLWPLTRLAGLLLAEFDGGVELRLQEANKGDAVRAILAELDDTQPVAYLGDDVTDEDAFRALNGRGLTALVRPTPRFTAAQIWLRPPGELIAFLRAWIEACGGGA